MYRIESDNRIYDDLVRYNICFKKYAIIKETKCGVWICETYGKKRFINVNAKKQWACLTKELAIESFISRKNRQISILNSQLEQAKEHLKLAKDIQIV